jgi:hypothetical protein
MTTRGSIPAGTLLWSERSLFQDLLRKVGTAPSPAYDQRVEALWENFDDNEKVIFTNFPWIEKEGNNKKSRIQLNAGPDTLYAKNLVVAYRYLNFLSHSCRPNCRIVDNGKDKKKPRWQLRTLVDIPDNGTELTIDYDDLPHGPKDVIGAQAINDLTKTVQKRNVTFQKEYFFKCKCEACKHLAATNKVRAEIDTLRKRLMVGKHPGTHTGWTRKAVQFDADVDRYISLCKSQHLFPMAMQAHELAWWIYENADRDIDEDNVLRPDHARWKEHYFGHIEIRRVLYGLWDPDLKKLMEDLLAKKTKEDVLQEPGAEEPNDEELEDEESEEEEPEDEEPDDNEDVVLAPPTRTTRLSRMK